MEAWQDDASSFTRLFSASAESRCWRDSTNRKLKRAGFFDQKTGALVFSLLSLYELLIELQSVSFSEFKKSLYQGSFNQTLGEMGGVVSIYHSTGKIDGNLYQFNAIG